MADDKIYIRPAAADKSTTLIMSDTGTESKKVEIVQVKRRLGLLSGVSLIVGIMIGSGIFISPKGVLQNTGSVGMCLVVWITCGLLSLCGAVVYAELGTLIPKSGGDYIYLLETYGSFPAFMCMWINVAASFPASAVIQALTFSEYLIDAVSDGCGPPLYTKKILAVATLLTITITNVISVRLAARVQILCTVIKMAGLLLIIGGGIVFMSKGKTESLTTGFEGTSDDVGSFTLAIYSGMFAYGGWQNLNFVIEELKNPKRNLVLSLLISVILVTVVYILVNMSYFVVMSKEEFLSSWAVGYTWGEKVLGPASIVIPLVVVCSVYGSGNGSYFVVGRILFAAGREGHAPSVASYIHINNKIPVIALLINTGLSLIMMIPSDVGKLLNFISFLGWIFISLSLIALIILRFRMKDVPREIKVPLIIPIIYLMVATFLLISPLIRDPRIEFLYAIGYLVVGAILYFIFVFFQVSIPGMHKIIYFLQIFFEIEPTSALQDVTDKK